MAELRRALDRRLYLPGAAWRHEVDRVWRRSWVCAGRLVELGLATPRRLAVVEVAAESVLLTSDDAGGLHAHANVCRHRGSQLCPHPPGAPPAPRAASWLHCAYHGWTYGLDGRLLHAPRTEGVDDLDPGSFGLHPVSAGTWGGYVFVRLAPGPHTLAAELGDLPAAAAGYPLEELMSGHRTVHDVAANWKVVVENHAERLHWERVHPELARLADVSAADGAGVPYRDGAWTFSFSGTSPRPPFDALDDAGRTRQRTALAFPNLMLSLSAEHVASFVLTPLDAVRTRITFDLLVAPTQLDTDLQDCADLWELVNRQDREACEALQRGLTSAFRTEGWYTPAEAPAADLGRWLSRRLREQA